VLIAIDGPAGAGKSTVARALARELGYTYLDSGAMYRSVALLWLQAPGREPAELARAARIELVPGDGPPRIVLDGRDVTDEIRAPEVSEAASTVAADPGVRAALVARQRELIADGDWVAEGRDIGTVVSPDAPLKVFLTADAGERARRRAADTGEELGLVLDAQTARDARDRERDHGALRLADDAVEIDTTGMSVDAVVERIAGLARDRGLAAR
jgi:cytidylate kinase